MTYENRLEYAREVLHTRITESAKQCEAIRQGICTVVPEALLNMVTFAELEEWISGRQAIDAELLQRHTRYEGAYGKEPRPKQIQWFWDWFKAQPQDIRRRFIQFCYAQPTIPANDEEFNRQRKRFAIKPLECPDPSRVDTYLPHASTCFFNLMLPKYSSYEVLAERLLKAITMDNVGLNAEVQDVLADGGPRDDHSDGSDSGMEEE